MSEPVKKKTAAPKKAAPLKKEKVEFVSATIDASKKPTSYAVGRRKSAIARVRLLSGEKGIVVNEKDFRVYFPSFEFQKVVEAPLKTVGLDGTFGVSVKVIGGGSRGQAEAVRHGIARAVVLFNEDYRKTMRSEGFLTRDPRVKERKKPGLKRARRAPQFSKR